MPERIGAAFRGVRKTIRMLRASAAVTTPELQRAGLLETSENDALGWVFRLYYWLGFVLVLLLPSYPQEPFFWFPAATALGIAWLIGMQASGHAILSADFAAFAARPGFWRRIARSMQAARVEVPEALRTEEAEREIDSAFGVGLPWWIPLVLLQIYGKLSSRAAAVGVIGLVGLLIGPWLSTIHWVGGWSPVSILYAYSFPRAAVLVLSLVIPVLVQGYTAHLRADAAVTQLVEEHGEPHSKTA